MQLSVAKCLCYLIRGLISKSARGITNLNLTFLEPSGHYMYHQFNINKSYVLPHTMYLYVLCGSQNKQRLLAYTALADWFV